MRKLITILFVLLTIAANSQTYFNGILPTATTGGGSGGPTNVEINFETVTSISETANKWTAGGSGFGHTGVSNLFLPQGVSGRIYSKYETTADKDAVFAFELLSATNEGFAGFDVSFDIATGGNLYIFQSGTGTLLSTISPAAGFLVGLYRDGTTGIITLQTSSNSGGSWDDIADADFSSTGKLRIKTDIGAGGFLNDPRGDGVTTDAGTPSPSITGTFQIVHVGTSLSVGLNTDNHSLKSFPARLSAKLESIYPSNFTGYQNYAVAGAGMSGIGGAQLTSAIAAIDGSDNHILIIESGPNDLGAGTSAATIYAAIKEAHEDAVAAGFITVAVTVAAYNFGDYNPSTTNATRLTLNQMIRDGVETGDIPASALFDLGDDTHFGTWNTGGQDPVYYDADEIHWTDEGHRYVGEDLLYPIIISLASGTLP